jgi:hypothetical protein
VRVGYAGHIGKASTGGVWGGIRPRNASFNLFTRESHPNQQGRGRAGFINYESLALPPTFPPIRSCGPAITIVSLVSSDKDNINDIYSAESGFAA